MTVEKNMSKKNIGSSFDDFLSESTMLDEATAVAVKRVIAWQIEQDHDGKEDTHQPCCAEPPAGRERY
jgi:hypothetical protein